MIEILLLFVIIWFIYDAILLRERLERANSQLDTADQNFWRLTAHWLKLAERVYPEEALAEVRALVNENQPKDESREG